MNWTPAALTLTSNLHWPEDDKKCFYNERKKEFLIQVKDLVAQVKHGNRNLARFRASVIMLAKIFQRVTEYEQLMPKIVGNKVVKVTKVVNKNPFVVHKATPVKKQNVTPKRETPVVKVGKEVVSSNQELATKKEHNSKRTQVKTKQNESRKIPTNLNANYLKSLTEEAEKLEFEKLLPKEGILSTIKELYYPFLMSQPITADDVRRCFYGDGMKLKHLVMTDLKKDFYISQMPLKKTQLHSNRPAPNILLHRLLWK